MPDGTIAGKVFSESLNCKLCKMKSQRSRPPQQAVLDYVGVTVNHKEAPDKIT